MSVVSRITFPMRALRLPRPILAWQKYELKLHFTIFLKLIQGLRPCIHISIKTCTLQTRCLLKVDQTKFSEKRLNHMSSTKPLGRHRPGEDAVEKTFSCNAMTTSRPRGKDQAESLRSGAVRSNLSTSSFASACNLHAF